jgi:hypothetical protein
MQWNLRYMKSDTYDISPLLAFRIDTDSVFCEVRAETWRNSWHNSQTRSICSLFTIFRRLRGISYDQL